MTEPDPTNPDPVAYFLAKLQELQAKAKQAPRITIQLTVEVNP